jgi:hypothetical protein
MASKKLSREQIAKLLQLTGGNIEAVTDLGVNPNQVLAVLISSPELLTSARTKAQSQAEELGLDSFREDFEYDPETNINSVSMAYDAMPEKYRDLAKVYFNQIKDTGGNKTGIDTVNKTIFKDSREQLKTDFGLTDDEFDSFTNDLKKDAESFIEQENTKRRNQMKAFMGRQKEYGIKEGVSATEGVLAKQSGFRGLSSLPLSFEDFSKAESERLSKELKKSGKNDAAIASLLPQFQERLKKDVGGRYQSVALMNLLKQNLMGE